MKRSTKTLALILCASMVSLAGCASAIEQWQTATQVLSASNRAVAVALDDQRISVDDAKAYRSFARTASDALDAWLLTISPDGKTSSGAARAAAHAALNRARQELIDLFSKRE